VIALVQRARSARVAVDGETVGETGWLADKTARLRVFRDDAGRMNRSLLDTGGEALVVSQFTLAGDAAKGARPSFVRAAAPDDARRLYEQFVGHLEGHLGRPVPTGRFGADMEVTLVGDGPVTIWLERPPTP
jgi:D-tyrosyl-tRNA(Tyr) deacylase